ncbi:hypothetical protein OPIT5_16370 [Opitutaceae bacterium TAV5]|nr:hypothetical protein OPIT5_16370 [Opitutaceae bacterium TAV5]
MFEPAMVRIISTGDFFVGKSRGLWRQVAIAGRV